ncbi:germinal center-associated signaling and motility protein isoform X2 [Callithrix jacchus]
MGNCLLRENREPSQLPELRVRERFPFAGNTAESSFPDQEFDRTIFIRGGQRHHRESCVQVTCDETGLRRVKVSHRNRNMKGVTLTKLQKSILRFAVSLGYFRCWDHHSAEGRFCLPWKKIHTFEKRQDSQNENKGMSSTPSQDTADQTYSEELCYTLIDHQVLSRRPSGNSAEEYYENVPCKAERPRESLGGTETEYSLLHMSSTPRHAPSPEDEYELLMPPRIASHFLQQPRPLMAPSVTQFSHL